MLKQNEINQIMAHAKRMQSRANYQVQFNNCSQYTNLQGDHRLLLAFIANVSEKFTRDRKHVQNGAIDLPTYFNDTFAGSGKSWWEDITGIFKASVEIRYIGTMHFYIHKGEIVLDLIQAYERNRGLGTYMLNHVLDTAEEMGIAIHTYPCDTDPNTASWQQAKQKTLKLRGWFSDFEFTSHYSTAKMSFNSKK
jgi:predicted acetyltransferase